MKELLDRIRNATSIEELDRILDDFHPGYMNKEYRDLEVYEFYMAYMTALDRIQ